MRDSQAPSPDAAENRARRQTASWAGVAIRVLIGLIAAFAMAACDDDEPTGPRPLDPTLVAQGKRIFRFDTFLTLLKLGAVVGVVGEVDAMSLRFQRDARVLLR